VTFSCTPPRIKPTLTGNKISYPSGLTTIQNYLLILNSNGLNEYENGTINTYSFQNTSSPYNALQFVSSFQVPSLANDLTSIDNRYVAIALAAQEQQILIYDYLNVLEPVQLFSITLPGSPARITNLSFFMVGSTYYLTGSRDLLGYKAGLFLIRIANMASPTYEIVFNYPNDFPQAQYELGSSSVPNYHLTYGAPTFLSQTNLLVAFPGEVMYESDRKLTSISNAYTYMSTGQTGVATIAPNALGIDLRSISMMAFDIEGYETDFLANTLNPLPYYTFFVPIAWDNNGNSVENPQVVQSNFAFRNTFWTSQSLDDVGGVGLCSYADPNVVTVSGNNSLLAVKHHKGSPANVVRISGFDTLKTQITGMTRQTVLANVIAPNPSLAPNTMPITVSMFESTTDKYNNSLLGVANIMFANGVNSSNGACRIPFYVYNMTTNDTTMDYESSWLTMAPLSMSTTFTGFDQTGVNTCTPLTFSSSAEVYCANFSKEDLHAFTFNVTPSSSITPLAFSGP
jgi:hypothetical protein